MYYDQFDRPYTDFTVDSSQFNSNVPGTYAIYVTSYVDSTNQYGEPYSGSKTVAIYVTVKAPQTTATTTSQTTTSTTTTSTQPLTYSVESLELRITKQPDVTLNLGEQLDISGGEFAAKVNVIRLGRKQLHSIFGIKLSVI